MAEISKIRLNNTDYDLKAKNSDQLNGQAASYYLNYNNFTNKPTIGNGTLTIQKNGSNVATFGANSTSNVTANISVPTTLGSLNGSLETTKLSEPTIVNGVTLTSQGIIDITSADRLAFLPADQIIIEKSTDGGATWVSAGFNDTQKRTIFSGLENGGISIPRNSSGKKSCNCMLRVTITGMKYNVPDGTAETDKYNYWNSSYVKSTERYFNPNLCTLWLSSNSDRIQTTIQMSTGANPNNWTTNVTANGCSGWSGRSTIKLGGYVFGGGTNQTGNYWNYRFIFRTQATDGSFDDSKLSTSYTGNAQVIHGIRFFSSNAWTVPSNMVRNGHLYTWDIDQNATFPSLVKAPIFYEGGTPLSSKYLGINAKAANSNKLNNQEASYYAKDSEVVKTSGTQDVGGDKTFTGTLKAKNLFVAPPDADTGPRIKVYNQVDEYYVNMPASSGTIALTSQIPTYTAGTGLSLSNGVFSVKTGYTTNGKNYKVAADTSGNLYVNVPWTDTDTNTHYTNYLQIKGNGTEAVKFTQNADKSLNLKPGNNVSISAASGEITISATDTNTHNSHAIISGTKSDNSTQIKGSASSGDITLGDSGVAAGTYRSVTVNSKGIVVAGSQADTDTNTWRKVQLNGVDKLGTGTNTNPLNIKAGSNMTITESGGTFTFAASGGSGGGMTWDWIFQGAGERNGSYYDSNGNLITIRGNKYKLLLFEINVNDVNFYLPIPTNTLSSSTYFYLAAGNTNNGAMGIVQVMVSNSNFSASVSNGNLTIWNVNVYAYK